MNEHGSPMLTIRHTQENGDSSLFLAQSVTFRPSEKQLIAYGSPGPDDTRRKDGVLTYTDGCVYVMNNHGKTVGVYVLSGVRRF